MYISVENSVIFESYLSNSLSQEEITRFEAKLSYDSDFKLQFEYFKQLETSVKQYFKRKQLKAKFAELDEEMDTEVPKGKLSYLKWFIVAGAAASILLVATLILNHSKSDGFYKNLVAENWPYEEGLPVKMSNKSVYDDAMNAYKLENWDEAETLLKQFNSDTSNYFLGIVAFQKENIKIAVNYFQEVGSNSIYYSDAQFRLALLSILEKDIQSAKRILKKLKAENSSYSIEANEILNKI